MNPRPDWWDQAACAGMGVELFFPTDGTGLAAAQAICARCPVARTCLEEALTMPDTEDFGVRGGMSERERRRMRATLRPPGAHHRLVGAS